jgi:hypothetical protein
MMPGTRYPTVDRKAGVNGLRFTVNSVWHLAISLETLVMKTPGLARAMEARACRAVRQQSATEPHKYKRFKIFNHLSGIPKQSILLFKLHYIKTGEALNIW